METPKRFEDEYPEEAAILTEVCESDRDSDMRTRWRKIGGEFVPRSRRLSIVESGTKVGRNDKCPCGSGLKYKKCCLN